MPFSRVRCFLFAVLLFSAAAYAQQSKPPVIDNDFVQKEFGSTCKLLPGPQPQTGDLDGDGVEDLVIAAHCTNPMLDAGEDSFVVIDPYNAFYGYGNPAITSQFASEDPTSRGSVLLVIHGAGADAWRAATPKAKFVIINLPFQQVVVRKMAFKKKTVMAIYAEETGADKTTSAIFWDGKKYKYAPLGSGLD